MSAALRDGWNSVTTWSEINRWMPSDADDPARSTSTVHSRRSMQLHALEAVLRSVPTDGTTNDYRRAVLDDNVIGLASESGRRDSWKPLRSLHRLDPSYRPFRALRVLWDMDPTAAPQLALLSALVHDPLLRATAPIVLGAATGELVDNKVLIGITQQTWPGRFPHSGLTKIGQYTNATWREAGYVTPAKRRAPSPPGSPAAAAYALYLGHLAGLSGHALFDTPWTSVLSDMRSEIESLATRAHAARMLEMRQMGGIIELSFPALDTPPVAAQGQLSL